MNSRNAILVIALLWFWAGGFYYPKWQKTYSEASISWDVAGYYHYLPGFFIYKDLKKQDWMPVIHEKYGPSPAYDQSFVHETSGHRVNKYFSGQAVMFTPFFLVGHAYASISDFPADGYSRPYQIAIWLGGLLVSILGLILLRKILRWWFDDTIVMWCLLALGLATNWAEYAAINNGMNHTWLLTLLCGLIIATRHFYQRGNWLSALGIGFTLGLAALTRPTEMIWILIPILWPYAHLNARIKFWRKHWIKLSAAVLIVGLVVCIQPVYWHYVTGEWIIQSYGGQGFNWFNPKIWRGLMGTNIGWFLYTPIMLLTIPGWVRLWRKDKGLFWPVFPTAMLAIYLTLAWGHFEEGGGLGQRNLIQVYPLMAIAVAFMVDWFWKRRIWKWIWIAILLSAMYLNAWWIHQAHKGGYFIAGQMTTPYFYAVVGRLNLDNEMYKLLDTREYFKGVPDQLSIIWEDEILKQDTTGCLEVWPDSSITRCLTRDHQFFGPIELPVDPGCGEWLRLEGDFQIRTHEWNTWRQVQWVVHFYQGDQVIKYNLIRINRLMPVDQQIYPLFFDVKLPDKPFDRCTMTLWNAESTETMAFGNLKASCFN